MGAGDAIHNVLGSIIDVTNNWMNVTGLSSVKESFDRVKDFFSLFDIISDVPGLLISFLWAPLGTCVLVVVFAALINKLLGVIS